MDIKDILNFLRPDQQEDPESIYQRQRVTRNAPPVLQETLDLLQRTDKVPHVQMKNMSLMTKGHYQPFGNTITFNTGSLNNLIHNGRDELPTKDVTTHEFNHALYQGMAYKADQLSGRHKLPMNLGMLSPAQRQFMDAWTQINDPDKTNFPQPAYMAGEKTTYRNGPDERLAFGVGNQQYGDSTRPLEDMYAIPHQDASAATDMSVLRDLYKKVLDEENQ